MTRLNIQSLTKNNDPTMTRTSYNAPQLDMNPYMKMHIENKSRNSIMRTFNTGSGSSKGNRKFLRSADPRKRMVSRRNTVSKNLNNSSEKPGSQAQIYGNDLYHKSFD